MNGKNGTVGSTTESSLSNRDAHLHGTKAHARGKDRLLLDLKAVVDDAQALLKEAVESSTVHVTNVPAYLESRLDLAKGNLHRVRTVIEQTARHATAVTNRYVKENPWKSMGYVTAASLLVSVLLVNAWNLGPGGARRAGK